MTAAPSLGTRGFPRRAIALLGLCLLTSTARADVVFLNGGEEINGAVKAMDARTVYVESEGKRRAVPRADVLRVKLVRDWRVPGEDDASQVRDPVLQEALKAPAAPGLYPDDGYLVILDDKACELKRDLSSSCVRRKLELILRERGKDRAANVRFYWLDGAETGRIDYARSITGGKISYLDDTSVQEGSEHPFFPLYDKLKSTKFSIPNVSTGSVLDYRYRVDALVHSSTFPFFGRMYFRGFEPTVLSRLTVVVPKGVDLRFTQRAMPAGARFAREERGDSVRFVWEVRDQPSYKEEGRMPPYPRLAPSVTFALADSWENVGASEAAVVRGRLEPGPDLEALAAALLRGKTAPAEKVEALYNWVVKEIKYQPVDMDSAGRIPRLPADIFQAKGGNALDKPFLLYVLLREAGFEPRLVFMESKFEAPFDESLPSLAQFPAAAVAVTVDGEELLLAPFDDARRWREPPGWLQGMRGLVVSGGKPGTLIAAAMSEPGMDGAVAGLRLTLRADGSVTGSFTERPRGVHQAHWRVLKNLKKEDLDKSFEKLAHDIHPNARLASYSVEHLDDPTRDLVVHLDYSIGDYAITAAGGYMAFRIPWLEHSAADVGAPSREAPMFWFERDRQAQRAEVSLPEGYSLYYVPEPARLGGADYFYRASYAPEAGALVFSEESGHDLAELPPARYPDYKSFREETARFAEKWIVLRKK